MLISYKVVLKMIASGWVNLCFEFAYMFGDIQQQIICSCRWMLTDCVSAPSPAAHQQDGGVQVRTCLDTVCVYLLWRGGSQLCVFHSEVSVEVPFKLMNPKSEPGKDLKCLVSHTAPPSDVCSSAYQTGVANLDSLFQSKGFFHLITSEWIFTSSFQSFSAASDLQRRTGKIVCLSTTIQSSNFKNPRKQIKLYV